MVQSKSTPLLDLLAQRWVDLKLDHVPDPTHHDPAPRPVFTPEGERKVREAAELHAQANASDPFAYGRALRQMKAGHMLPSEVRSDAMSRIAARKAEGVTFPHAIR